MTYPNLQAIKEAIMNDRDNQTYTKQGFEPLFLADPSSKIMIVGQAPGIKAQASRLTWNDASGDRLREWLGVDRKTFYNPKLFAMVPMDFYYPGKSKSGDKPPRKGFAKRWHPLILEHLPNLQLIILVGSYAQHYYLNNQQKKTLTETVRSYQDYIPKYFPLVHPSPRNIGWHLQHPWFIDQVIPDLKKIVNDILYSSDSSLLQKDHR